MMVCVYCNQPEIKARVIVRNEFAFAFPTNIPIVPGHILICPTRCVAKLSDLNELEIDAILKLTEDMKSALSDSFGAKGFNFAWNEGKVAGQNVPHFHLHLLPRKPRDTGITTYEPRKFLYRPGSRKTIPEAELKEVSEKIRLSLEKVQKKSRRRVKN